MLTPATSAVDHCPAMGHRSAVVLGGDGLKEPLRQAGIEIVEAKGKPEADAVLVGWYREFTMDDLEAACHAVFGGAILYSSSQSVFFASADGRALGTSRAICAMISSVTGVTEQVVGKPSLTGLRCAARRLGVAPQHLAVVGDDPELEMAMARRAGALGIAVTTASTRRTTSPRCPRSSAASHRRGCGRADHPVARRSLPPHRERIRTGMTTTTASLRPSAHPGVLADLVPGSSLLRDTLLVVGGAGLTGLCAQVSLHTPLSPVPFALQTLAVLLVGTALGTVRGAAAMLLYLAAGVAGVPWFAHHTHGLGGPGFGYVVGFVLAAVLGQTEDVNSRNCPTTGRTYLSTTQGFLRTPMNSSRHRDFQFGLGDSEPAKAALMPTPRNGRSAAHWMLRESRLPREAAGPRLRSLLSAPLLDGL
ncbi:biotin transporter BioY [Streptomyces humidus]|uniref:biotin transporter BioY n=1 Tax=Streptomyces humidus TaxID=52259 RepID=UPI0033321E03